MSIDDVWQARIAALPEDEMRKAILGLAGSVVAAADQAQTMTDAELGAILLNGGWTTIEIHEAGRRLLARPKAEQQLVDWLREQLDGCIEYAERLPGQGPGLHMTTCLLRDLRDARNALDEHGNRAAPSAEQQEDE